MDDGDGRQLVEVRSYALVPGGAGPFVDHFEAHFLGSQEGLGMDIVGLFTVPGDDARFVWVRRVLDPARRGAALAAFYGGPVWAEHGGRANELMVDHTDVHLLRPDASRPAFATGHVRHDDRPAGAAAPGAGDRPAGAVVVATYDLPRPADLPDAVAAAMGPAAAGAGAVELGRLVTADVANDFPRLPVHEDRPVAVWLLSDHAGGEAGATAAREVAAAHGLAVRTTVLAPTTRSTLR